MPNPEPLSPLWFVERLSDKLRLRRSNNALLQRYSDGEHPFEVATVKYKTDFIRMLQKVTDNWMPLIVDAVEERMNIQGFRFSEETKADKDAWAMFQSNNLDSDSNIHHNTLLTLSQAYVLVWGNQDGQPRITIEHPDEMITVSAPGNRREIIAAFKTWVDEWSGDETFGDLYTPDTIYHLRVNVKNGEWEIFDFVNNPLREVPVVPFVNRSNFYGIGKSEFADVMTTQDQINKLVKDMLVASEFAAVPMRWGTGLEEELDENGKPKNQFVAELNRMLVTPNEDARFGEFQAADLGNYTKAIENRIQSIASRTRTPAHYLLGQSGQFPSGESLKATETGLIAKTRRRHTAAGECWEKAIRLGFKVMNPSDPRARDFRMETLWGDPESRSEAQMTDSLVKLMSIGVPKRALWERYGFGPTEIERFRAYLMDEALETMLAGGNGNNGPSANGASQSLPNPTVSANGNQQEPVS